MWSLRVTPQSRALQLYPFWQNSVSTPIEGLRALWLLPVSLASASGIGAPTCPRSPPRGFRCGHLVPFLALYHWPSPAHSESVCWLSVHWGGGLCLSCCCVSAPDRPSCLWADVTVRGMGRRQVPLVLNVCGFCVCRISYQLNFTWNPSQCTPSQLRWSWVTLLSIGVLFRVYLEPCVCILCCVLVV